LGVVGSYFLYTKTLSAWTFLPAMTIGLMSVAVLNLNNMRDRLSDKASGKKTVAVILGFEKSKTYHFFILGIAYAVAFVYFYVNTGSWLQFLPLVAFIPIVVHLKKVQFIRLAKDFDPELKKVALSTFLFSLLFLLTALA